LVQRIARALGWFSLGLGAIQLIAPRRLLALVGIPATNAARVAITRLIGVREVGVAPWLLVRTRPARWLWARVAGDAMDLALMARAVRAADTHRPAVIAATAAVAAVSAVDVAAAVMAQRQSGGGRDANRHKRVIRAVTVNRAPAELYRFWRNLENLPRVMPHLEAVEERGGTTSHWIARAPMGARVEWDAEITEDTTDTLVSWRSLPGADVHNAGTVRFTPAPGARGTEVTVEMEYEPPGGIVGVVAAKLTGEDPEQQVSDALRRFKQVMETGEPILSDATAEGHKLRQHPAQPLEDERVAVTAGAGGELS
jgi:uncharacterized membrane protein